MRRKWGWPPFRELLTSAIALGVLVYTGAVLWPQITDGEDGIRRAGSVFALLGPIVGTIIGFYFGTKSGEQIAEKATEGAVEAKATSVQEVEAATDRERTLLEGARELLGRIQELEGKKDQADGRGTKEGN